MSDPVPLGAGTIAVNCLLGLLAVIVTTAILVEIRAWKRGTRLITRSQKAFRISAAVMLDIVLLMVIFSHAIKAAGPLIELSYWSVAILLACLVAVLAMADVRAGLVAYQVRRREVFKDVFGNERQDE